VGVDEYEMNNLADNPEYASVKQRLRRELQRWMNNQHDPGAILDTEAERNALKKTPFPGK
jgi:N-sulfoglucosamine sulfohydrolase